MVKSTYKSFDRGTQWLIASFALFVAFPILEIPFVGVSITFPLFLWICFRVKMRSRAKLFMLSGMLDKLMGIFVLMAGISILFAPDADRGGVDLFIRDVKNFFYLPYWFLVYLFFRRWYFKINIRRLSLFVLIGVFLSTVLVLFGSRTRSGFFVIGPFGVSQNAYAFNTVACIGVGVIYLMLQKRSVFGLLYALSMIFPLMRSESRSGIVIIVLQGVAISLLVWLDKNKILRQVMVVVGGLLILGSLLAGVLGEYRFFGREAGRLIRPHSSELALLLEDPEYVNEQDKSWLIRKVQVEKGFNLFKENPISGVGWGHFRYMRGDVDIAQHKHLHRSYDSYALNRSSHNSYIQVLAETGLLGFIPFILIQIYIIKRIFQSFLTSPSIAEVLPLGISLLGVAVYFWTVSAITGAAWYFMVGLFSGAVAKEQKR